MMQLRNSGTLYKSYLETVDDIKKQSEKLFYLESVLKLSLFDDETTQEVEEKLKNFSAFSTKMLEKCSEKKYFSAKTALRNIIPNAENCYKKFLNGCNGKGFGSLGGAPKDNQNARKNNPKTTPKQPLNKNKNKSKNKNIEYKSIDIEKDRGCISESDSGNISTSKKTIDPYTNPLANFYKSEYKKVFGQAPFLMKQQLEKLSELSEIPDIEELMPIAIKRLKSIKFDFKGESEPKKVYSRWLLTGDNFAKVIDGEFGEKGAKIQTEEVKAEKQRQDDIQKNLVAINPEVAKRIEEIEKMGA